MTRSIALVLVIILLFNVCFFSQINSSAFNYENNDIESNFVNMSNDTRPTLNFHSIIRIDSNNDFLIKAGIEGWNGTGQLGNPFIIENYEINAQGESNGIYIGNITTIFFKIRNCTIYGASGNYFPYGYGGGITLANIQNPSFTLATLENNTCVKNKIGIYTYASNINSFKNNNCSNNTQMGIFIDYSDFNKFINNSCEFNNHSGIFINVSSTNILDNNTCCYNTFNGIFMNLSTFNTIVNNSCCYNKFDGIFGNNSLDNNTITKNKIYNNFKSGISLITTSEDNIISNNMCFFNGLNGLYISGYSSKNIINDNILKLNNKSGIIIYQSDGNILNNNIITDHGNGSGIEIELSALCVLDNNTCTYNHNGIFLKESDTNTLSKNNCLNNSNGTLLYGSDNNLIANNTLKFNLENGLVFINSTAYNYIEFNEIANNTNGIRLTFPGLASVLNFFSNNEIAFNTQYGIFIENGYNNHFFHNLILFNNVQVLDSNYQALNTDYYSYNNEGNYWSDYTGLDNGSNGRMAGDGIGDTEIPHLGVDNYPFINAWGWRIVPKPQLNDPGKVNFTGTYDITWNVTPRAKRYILYEDTDIAFNSPSVVYNGSGFVTEITDKDNGTFYYMLRATNDYGFSPWSDMVDINVDWPPSMPTGLDAFMPTGYTISLLWNLNPEPDLMGYKIYMNQTGLTQPDLLIDEVSNTTTTYLVQNLTEETSYYFAIKAFDKYSNSTISNIASATTGDVTPPAAPENVTATAISDTEINLNWNASSEQDLAGYQVFMAEGAINATFLLRYKIASLNTSYHVTGLKEKTTYYFKIQAFDEVPNNSTDSTIAWATTLDMTPPIKPVGLEIKEPTYDSLTVSWLPNPESDVIGYLLFRTDNLGKDINLTKEPINITQFKDTGLNESTTYYYRLVAIDDAGLISLYTDYVSGTTLTRPKPPVIKTPLADFNITEDVVDDTSIRLLTWFSDPNNDPLSFYVKGSVNINVTINQQTGKVTLKPGLNWNGVETLTFYATDGLANISDSIIITVVGVNDDPGPVEILWPNDDEEIKEGILLDFRGQCSDPDLVYGDTLTYKWFSSEDGLIGNGPNITEIKLSPGYHIITLEVTDSQGSKAYDTININVLKKSEDSEPGLLSGLTLIILILIIIVIIIIAVVAVLLLGRKRKIERAEESIGEEIRGTLQPEGDIAGLKLPPEAEGVDEGEEEETPEKLKKSKKEETGDEIDREIEEELAELEVEVPGQEDETVVDEDSEVDAEDDMLEEVDESATEEPVLDEEPVDMDLESPMMPLPPDATADDLAPPEDLVKMDEELSSDQEALRDDLEDKDSKDEHKDVEK